MQIMDKTTLPAVYDAKISDIFRTRHITSAEILDKDSHLNERNYKKETILRVVYELYANSSIYLLYICIFYNQLNHSRPIRRSRFLK